ncbi:protoporphyrinogen oxidase [Sporosarcina sp. HYO08]|nr:protoporphyrinogen oxidase [Sporosarcina sp. HYO08]KXH87582.1 protoporphyrinogen oxidase [Sporosarcina sp. HYO08]
MMKRIVVIGGGITGLSAAYYAKKYFQDQNTPVELTLIEKSAALGGKIKTLHRDEFVIERGPEAFLARKMPIIELSRELGILDELVGTNPAARTNYIYHKNKLHPMPPGLILGIPTKITPFMKTGLISPMGKMRAAMDLVLPKKSEKEDESLGHFIERRLGREVLDYITEPLLGGIYAGDTHALSLQATFPNFAQMEEKHGSLIKGMLASRQRQAPSTGNLPEAAKRSMFLTFKNGMTTIVDRLAEAIGPANIKNEVGVQAIDRKNAHYTIRLDDGSAIEADGLIVALPTFEAAHILGEFPASKWLEEIHYVSVANVVLAFDENEVDIPLDGSGFVVPKTEGRNITACTWTSSKWTHTAPQGKRLVRCYIGRGGAEDWVQLSDGELLKMVQKDLTEMMGIRAEPLFYEITRLQQSMPQYPVKHVEEIQKLRASLAKEKPGIYLCGAGYAGVGIPDCIQQGKEAAEQLIEYLEAEELTATV